MCEIDDPPIFYFDFIIGRGGTGDTWAFLDTRTGKQVAIKFIKRPLPKVLLQNIQREFTVRFISPQLVSFISAAPHMLGYLN